MKNNKGFSYVEMIIVIAIMSLVAGTIALSIGLVNRTNVSKAGDRLISMCNQARTSALTKGTNTGYLNLVKKNDHIYANVGKELTFGEVDFSAQEWVKIADHAITFQIGVPSGDPDDEIAQLANNSIKSLHFSQSNGGMKDGNTYECVLSHGKNKCTVVIDSITGRCEKQ